MPGSYGPGHGKPSPAYPFTWAVSEWTDDQDGSTAVYDQLRLARDLAGFPAALDRADEWGCAGVWTHGDPFRQVSYALGEVLADS